MLTAWATQQYEVQGQSAVLAEQSGHRVALFSIVAFLVVGTAMLLLVNERRARETAMSSGDQSAA